MLSLPPPVRVFLATQATDMRRSFDGLCALVQSQLQQDPFSGHLFVFINRRRDRVKLLYWCGDGFAIWYRRLEKGTFQVPVAGQGQVRLEMKASELSLILDGIELTSVRRRPRYERPVAVQA
jgi:transposase